MKIVLPSYLEKTKIDIEFNLHFTRVNDVSCEYSTLTTTYNPFSQITSMGLNLSNSDVVKCFVSETIKLISPVEVIDRKWLIENFYKTRYQDPNIDIDWGTMPASFSVPFSKNLVLDFIVDKLYITIFSKPFLLMHATNDMYYTFKSACSLFPFIRSNSSEIESRWFFVPGESKPEVISMNDFEHFISEIRYIAHLLEGKHNTSKQLMKEVDEVMLWIAAPEFENTTTHAIASLGLNPTIIKLNQPMEGSARSTDQSSILQFINNSETFSKTLNWYNMLQETRISKGMIRLRTKGQEELYPFIRDFRKIFSLYGTNMDKLYSAIEIIQNPKEGEIINNPIESFLSYSSDTSQLSYFRIKPNFTEIIQNLDFNPSIIFRIIEIHADFEDLENKKKFESKIRKGLEQLKSDGNPENGIGETDTLSPDTPVQQSNESDPDEIEHGFTRNVSIQTINKIEAIIKEKFNQKKVSLVGTGIFSVDSSPRLEIFKKIKVPIIPERLKIKIFVDLFDLANQLVNISLSNKCFAVHTDVYSNIRTENKKLSYNSSHVSFSKYTIPTKRMIWDFTVSGDRYDFKVYEHTQQFTGILEDMTMCTSEFGVDLTDESHYNSYIEIILKEDISNKRARYELNKENSPDFNYPLIVCLNNSKSKKPESQTNKTLKIVPKKEYEYIMDKLYSFWNEENYKITPLAESGQFDIQILHKNCIYVIHIPLNAEVRLCSPFGMIKMQLAEALSFSHMITFILPDHESSMIKVRVIPNSQQYSIVTFDNNFDDRSKEVFDSCLALEFCMIPLNKLKAEQLQMVMSSVPKRDFKNVQEVNAMVISKGLLYDAMSKILYVSKEFKSTTAVVPWISKIVWLATNPVVVNPNSVFKQPEDPIYRDYPSPGSVYESSKNMYKMISVPFSMNMFDNHEPISVQMDQELIIDGTKYIKKHSILYISDFQYFTIIKNNQYYQNLRMKHCMKYNIFDIEMKANKSGKTTVPYFVSKLSDASILTIPHAMIQSTLETLMTYLYPSAKVIGEHIPITKETMNPRDLLVISNSKFLDKMVNTSDSEYLESLKDSGPIPEFYELEEIQNKYVLEYEIKTASNENRALSNFTAKNYHQLMIPIIGSPLGLKTISLGFVCSELSYGLIEEYRYRFENKESYRGLISFKSFQEIMISTITMNKYIRRFNNAEPTRFAVDLSSWNIEKIRKKYPDIKFKEFDKEELSMSLSSCLNAQPEEIHCEQKLFSLNAKLIIYDNEEDRKEKLKKLKEAGNTLWMNLAYPVGTEGLIENISFSSTNSKLLDEEYSLTIDKDIIAKVHHLSSKLSPQELEIQGNKEEKPLNETQESLDDIKEKRALVGSQLYEYKKMMEQKDFDNSSWKLGREGLMKKFVESQHAEVLFELNKTKVELKRVQEELEKSKRDNKKLMEAGTSGIEFETSDLEFSFILHEDQWTLENLNKEFKIDCDFLLKGTYLDLINAMLSQSYSIFKEELLNDIYESELSCYETDVNYDLLPEETKEELFCLQEYDYLPK